MNWIYTPEVKNIISKKFISKCIIKIRFGVNDLDEFVERIKREQNK